MSRPQNILMIITDQERAVQHFPPDWEQKNLPSMTLLKQNGLSFKNAVCNACMCSPSRSTLFTSLYPAQHGVTDTLSFGGRYSVTETELDNTLPTIAKVLHRSHNSQYRGKWHMCKGRHEKSLMAAEVAVFGFAGWTPPDSGEDTKLENFGGGYANHDANYIRQAIDFIEDYKKEKKKAKAAGKTQKPFFLVVSLVNPHDVLSYPTTYEAGGYEDPKWLHGDIQLPATVNENLQTNYKPTAQQMNLQLMAASLGPLRIHPSPDGGKPVMDDQRLYAYINFYGNLLKHIDGEIGKLLDLFYNEADDNGKRSPKQLAKETLIIRTADHGEMGLAHGGLRQKAFNAYEETMRVPLIFSNPKTYAGGAESNQLISLIDLLPTIAGYYGVKPPKSIRGVDMSPVLRDPSLNDPIQDSTLFTFDDIRAGATNVKEPVNAADRVRCLRQENWKYSRYFRTEGSYPEEYELYYLGGIHDPNYTPQTELEKYLLSQPYEYINLAYEDNPLIADWPPEIKNQIAQKRDELALALEQKEQLLLIN